MGMKSTENDELLGRPAEPPVENRILSPPRPGNLQSRLHSFSFPTHSWGCHKFLRCMKIRGIVSGEPSGSAAPAAAQHDQGDLKRAGFSSSLEKSQPRRGSSGGMGSKESSSSSSAAAAAAAMRPWNLRTRRAACNAPAENESSRNRKSAAGSPYPLPAKKGAGKGKRPRFWVSLSKEEIEEDFMLLKGTLPSRNPKKRPRIIQDQLDSIFPGSWLTEITPDLYRVDESKRPRTN